MSEFLELRIPINVNTTKKIVALAALTGLGLEAIKDNMAGELIDEEAFDAFVSAKLRAALTTMDGGEVEEETYEQQVEKSNAPASNIVDEIAGHSLSGDEDEGITEFREQPPQPPPPPPAAKQQPLKTAKKKNPDFAESDYEVGLPDIAAPDVGNDAEAFLNAAMTTAAPAKPTRDRTSTAKKSFNENSVKVKISDYTGDESGESYISESLF
jgi:hypothetical protein